MILARVFAIISPARDSCVPIRGITVFLSSPAFDARLRAISLRELLVTPVFQFAKMQDLEHVTGNAVSSCRSCIMTH